MIYFSILLIAMFITIAFTPILKVLALKTGHVDLPNKRKIHSHPIPKIGGVAMAIGALAPTLFWMQIDDFMISVLISSGIIVGCGLIDDAKDLNYKLKFTAQIIATLIVVIHGEVIFRNVGMLLPGDVTLPYYIALPLTSFFIVGAINAINLSDGLDGLAGGISLLSFLCLGVLSYSFSDNITLLAFAAAGSILGFLPFNTHPATIFMGDAGSQLLGFLAAVLAIKLTQTHHALNQVIPLIIIGFSVLDTLTVMLERLIKGRSPFIADMNHFHHKLIRIGLFQSEAVSIIYSMQALLISSAIFFRYYSEWYLLGLYLSFSGVIIIMFLLTDKSGWKMKRSGFFDKNIKANLKPFKEKLLQIKLPFIILSFGLPLQLFFLVLFPKSIPKNMTYLAIMLICLLLAAIYANGKWKENLLRAAIFIIIPFLIYHSEYNKALWITQTIDLSCNVFFIILLCCMFFTLIFSRRKKRFIPSPMDFLIIFIAFLVPNLPEPITSGQGLGILTAKILFLIFGFEILFTEIRVKWLDRMCIATCLTMATIIMRGII